MNLLEAIAHYLIERGHCTATGTDLFLDYAPALNTCTVLYEYEPSPPLDENASPRHVQIYVRRQTYDQAHNDAWAIYKTLNQPETIWLGTRYLNIFPKQTPFKLDTNEAYTVFCFNATVTTQND